MKISIPNLSLVVLIGPSGSGKSTFARKHFLPTEILSSDACRAMVSDEENNQAVTTEAFEVLHFIAAKRLAFGRLTVIDATNVQPEARRATGGPGPAVPLPARSDRAQYARKSLSRTQSARDDRTFGPHVIRQQHAQLRRSLRGSRKEGFRHIFVLKTSGGSRSRNHRAGSALERQAHTNTAPSTSSATSTAAAMNWKPC